MIVFLERLGVGGGVSVCGKRWGVGVGWVGGCGLYATLQLPGVVGGRGWVQL